MGHETLHPEGGHGWCCSQHGKKGPTSMHALNFSTQLPPSPHIGCYTDLEDFPHFPRNLHAALGTCNWMLSVFRHPRERLLLGVWGCWGGQGWQRDCAMAAVWGAASSSPSPQRASPQALSFSQALLQECISRWLLPPTFGNHEWSSGAGAGNLGLALLAHLSQPCT